MPSINNPLRIMDIQTSDILFYDPAFDERCYKFCKERDIDCLPSLEDPLKLFRRDDNTWQFLKDEVDPARVVKASESAFHPSMLERFRRHPLLFVFSADEFSGVVHFSDYNRPAVSQYLYGVLSAFEQTLRDILVKQPLRNTDMVEYFRGRQVSDDRKERDRYKKKVRDFERDKAKWDKLPAFQAFYLDDLIGLLRFSEIMEVSNKVVDLRNGVMHAHELVNMRDPSTDDFIYDFESFGAFFAQAMALHRGYRSASNRLAFLSAES